MSAPIATPAWGDGGSVVQARQPAFWLLLALIAAGAAYLWKNEVA